MEIKGAEIMSDEKPELVFEDLQKGRSFRPLVFPITPELVDEYMETVEDHHPLYWDQTKAKSLGGPVAPPGLAAVFARLSYLQDNTMPSGGVLAKQEFEFQTPAQVGDTLTVEARVFESYVDKKGRKRVNFLITASNQNQKQICLIRLYAIWPK